MRNFVVVFMKAVFYNIYRVLRTLIVLGIVAFVTIFVALYLILLIPSVQSSIKGTAEEELSKLLNADVKIDDLSISPFNQVVLRGVEIPDLQGKALLKVDKLGAGFSLYNLAVRKRIVFTYAEIIGLSGSVYKETSDSPLNIQFIIDALSPKDKTNPPTKFDLAIYNIVLRKSRISYDVLGEKYLNDKFDKNHIRISDLRADIELPRLKNEEFYIKVKRLSFEEKSGLDLKNLTVNTQINDDEISVSDFRVQLPGSLLKTKDFSITFNSLKTLGSEIGNVALDINTNDSYVTLKDLACFAPALLQFDERMNVAVIAQGTLKNLEIPELLIETADKKLFVEVNGRFENLLSADSLRIDAQHINVMAKADEIAKITSNIAQLSPQAKSIITGCGNVRVEGAVEGSKSKLFCVGNVMTDNGQIQVDGNFLGNKEKMGFEGHVSTEQFDLGSLLGKQELLGETSFSVDVNGNKTKAGVTGTLNGNISYIDVKGYRYNNISADLEVKPSEYNGLVAVNDENLTLSLDGMAVLKGEQSQIDLDLTLAHCNFDKIKLSDKYPDHNMSFKAKAVTSGSQTDNWNGRITLEDFRYVNDNDEGIVLDKFDILADNTHLPYRISINSDILNGELEGAYNLKSVVPAMKNIVAQIFPALFEQSDAVKREITDKNDFHYTLNVENNVATNSILTFFNSPITLLHPITLSGHLNETNNSFSLDVDAPFIAQKNKLIENSSISVAVDSMTNKVMLNAHTVMPTKNGKMTLDLAGNGTNNRMNTDVSWKIDRKQAFHGNVDLSLGLGRVKETNQLMATVDVNPTTMVFNDTTWYIHDSKIGYYNKSIRVDDFKVTCDKQFVRINGRTTPDSDERLIVELKDINLGYVFETLQINHVTFGGYATGKIVASDLFSVSPKLETDGFFVDGMTYNGTLLGDADMISFWDNDKKFVAIQASIKQENGCNSEVDGEIYPMNDSLRFDFETEKLKVGFMKPFMSAITSDLDGFVSGNARLFGKFSTLNMYGDVFVEDLKVKVDFTNVYYWATDSIKINPGMISFSDVQLKDRNGKTAMLSGYVSHEDFHNAAFEFNITDAKDLLCYDIPEKRLDAWYGTIYGSGSAFVKGEPGYVGIDVHMTNAANSKFYFELSDSEEAVEYDFITFTDKRKKQKEAELLAGQSTQEQIIKNFEQQKKKENDSQSTRIQVNIDAEVNPLGQLILVMDPVGGDKIKATGSGSLIMKYDTQEDLFMSGKYVLDKGTYNFTLQDIIVKDFRIKENSSIAFDGNPFDAKIDISAIYPLTANLLDLDESFANDKEFNRTNVPVYAVLNVLGSIAQPTINFDLEFPTLTNDAYRKVKSIVSTDDMMNRQIIYLLALNRFYTPEYMGGTNRNNELASVASSTISSQLTSMLGQLNDNISISPNFKSDKGDFSDVEVNLALSSQLLNNRLLLNGNFGYRDKMVTSNNSNFIGDFDIEYLLNNAGNIRLKAYNHFNDQNYYVKNALTTQGVGVVFKFDFDNPFGSLRKKKKLKLESEQDSVKLESKESVIK